MDVVLGVSMAPETVRMVLVEGEAAGGVTVDQDGFDLAADATPVAAADHVVAAILGTQESAAEGGYQLTSTGVSWTDPAKAAALRDALAARNIENVILVSAVMAAAALAQAMGSATNWARTALLLVEPTSATRAVVDTSNGTIADVQRHPLPSSDDAALAKLTTLVAGAELMRADGLFLVGSEVDIPSIKPALEAATSLSVTTPEEPEMALARGASLAAANARLGAPRTIAMSSTSTASTAAPELAYGAAAQDDSAPDGHPLPAPSRKRRSRKSVLTIAAVTTVFIGGVVALAVALAVGIRANADQRPGVGPNVVAPANPPPPNAGAPPPPSAVSGPHPAAPPQAPAPSSQPSPHSGDHQHWDDWLHRHLGQ